MKFLRVEWQPELSARSTKLLIIGRKHKAKDSVFTDLFHIPKNALALTRSLCPEIEATEDDIEYLTLNTVLMIKPFNDLGLLVKGNLILLAEAQSTWSLNILVRMFMYLAETYHRYIEERKEFNIYGTKKISLPKPACFVIYTGRLEPEGDERISIPEVLSLGKEFFGRDSILDLKVKVISASGKGDIVKEYIRFCHVLDEMVRVNGRTAKAVEETIRICQNEDVLKEYLSERKKEVNTIMRSLFSQEEVNKRRDYEMREEGREQGIISTVIELLRAKQPLSLIEQVSKFSKERIIEIGKMNGIALTQ